MNGGLGRFWQHGVPCEDFKSMIPFLLVAAIGFWLFSDRIKRG